jgi:hypothetical protein
MYDYHRNRKLKKKHTAPGSLQGAAVFCTIASVWQFPWERPARDEHFIIVTEAVIPSHMKPQLSVFP